MGICGVMGALREGPRRGGARGEAGGAAREDGVGLKLKWSSSVHLLTACAQVGVKPVASRPVGVSGWLIHYRWLV